MSSSVPPTPPSSDSGLDSDSDSSSELDIGEEELASYKEQVNSNPLQYAAHRRLVSALRSLDNQGGAALREAREKMAAIFPLSEEEWLEWLSDEERQATDPVVKMQVLSLFEQAVQDYRSVAVWERYVHFAEDFHNDDVAAVRSLYEEALTQVGLHVAEGARLWQAYREFELKHGEVERARKLFVRQLGLPLLGMEDTLQNYLAWESAHGGDPTPGRLAYESAWNRLQDYLPFEQQIASPWSASNPDYTKVEIWKSYLQFEEKKNDPSRVQMLYERAIQRFCLLPELWLSYLSYLEYALPNVHDVVLSVYRRAVRNYPWSSQLWANYILALERASRMEQEVRAVFEKSLQAGMSAAEDFMLVFQTFADFQRRQLAPSGTLTPIEGDDSERCTPIRETLQRAIDTLNTYFPGSAWTTELRVYWATLEGRVFRDIDKSITQWEKVILDQGSDPYRWCQYAECLQNLVGIDRVRTIYKRAANCLIDSASATSLFNAWLLFERISGDLCGFEEARRRQTTKLTALVEREQREKENQQEIQSKRKQRSNEHNLKRKTSSTKPTRPAKRKKAQAEEQQVAASGSCVVVEEAPDNAHPGPLTEEESKTLPQEEEEKKTKPTIETDGSSQPERTLRVVGIPWKFGEVELKEAFAKCAPVLDARVVRDRERRSKGFAFVEYYTAKDAEAALTQQWELGGRRVTVQSEAEHMSKKHLDDHNQPTQPAQQPKRQRNYNDSLTIFVSNLPFDATDADLHQLFAAVGPLRNVRLIRDQKQQSKGYAYIEYQTAEGVASALSLNQSTLRGRIINVARSCPPSNKPSERFPPPITRRQGPRPKLQAAPTRNSPHDDKSETKSQPTATSGTSTQRGSKSNAHFRALLAKGKQ